MEVKRTIDDRIKDMGNKLTAKDQEVKRLEAKLEEKDDSVKSIKEENQSLKQQMLNIEINMNKLNAEVANADEKSVRKILFIYKLIINYTNRCVKYLFVRPITVN